MGVLLDRTGSVGMGFGRTVILMADLIYRDELIKEIRRTPNFGKDWDKALCEAIVKDAPTVDAVEVVRCKDCKHRNGYECNHIMLGNTKCGVTDDWFCADGKPKDGDHHDQ